MYDLAVAYRIYPLVSKTPAFYPDDKYKLSEMCLRSFKAGLGRLKAKIWVLLDGCPPEYEKLFRKVFPEDTLEFVPLDKAGNAATFSLQADILLKQTDAPYVYFAEDDYFYLDGAIDKIVIFMRNNPEVDFVTSYDHPDYYYTSTRCETHRLKVYGDRHWSTVSSTCLTFLTSREVLRRTASMFKTFGPKNTDCSIWLVLTQKLGLLTPRVHMSSLFRLKLLAMAWIWGWRRILFGRTYRLWAPIPTLSTHMQITDLSPTIDWKGVFSDHTEVSEDHSWVEIVKRGNMSEEK